MKTLLSNVGAYMRWEFSRALPLEELIELGTETHYPSLDDPSADLFESFSLEILEPDRQIATDQIKKKALD